MGAGCCNHHKEEVVSADSSSAPVVVFVLGGPGSGKGTQSLKISEKFGFTHLSAGDLLREERQRVGSEFGELIESFIKDGKIVPVAITVSLIKKAMETTGWVGGRFLIDGFPRNAENLKGWKEGMAKQPPVELACLYFDCPEEVMEQRLLSRGASSGRSDDNIESIKKRFKVYQDETMPVIEGFRSIGKLRRVIADRSVEEVWIEVSAIFTNLGF